MKKVLIILIVSSLVIFFINILVAGLVFALHSSNLINSIDKNVTATIPEPAIMMLLGIGLIGLASLGRKKLFKK